MEKFIQIEKFSATSTQTPSESHSEKTKRLDKERQDVKKYEENCKKDEKSKKD